MKDEEMAGEWVMNNSKDIINKVSNGETNLFGVAEQAFLAGLKAGRPQWHKVADGLPISDKDKYYFVVDKMNAYMIARFYEGKWSNYSVIDEVIAWCEIPTFDKE